MTAPTPAEWRKKLEQMSPLVHGVFRNEFRALLDQAVAAMEQNARLRETARYVIAAHEPIDDDTPAIFHDLKAALADAPSAPDTKLREAIDAMPGPDEPGSMEALMHVVKLLAERLEGGR